MAKSITAFETQTGDLVKFRNVVASKPITGTVLSRKVEGTKVHLEIFEPGFADQEYVFGASDHIVLLDR